MVSRLRSRYWVFSWTGFRAGRLFLAGRFDEVEALAREQLGDHDAPRFAYAERARALVALLEPRADHCVVAANGFYCHGPVPLYLARLDCTLRDVRALGA